MSISISLPPEYRNHKEIIIKGLQYLTPRSKPMRNIQELSNSERERLDLALWFHKLEEQGKRLFHLTLTYNHSNKASEEYMKCIAEKTSILFYQYALLPFLYDYKQNFYKKNDLPICYSFLDKQPFNKETVGIHNHMMLAVSPDIQQRLIQVSKEDAPQQIVVSGLTKKNTKYYIGAKSIKRIRTMNVKRCKRNQVRVLYASKAYDIYPEYKVFGYK